MDFPTYLFLPLPVVYDVRPDLFESPAMRSVAAFGLFPDLDTFLGVPGLLHSLLLLIPFAIIVLVVEQWGCGRVKVSPIIVAFVGSHLLLLDFVDGGPVTLLFPVVETGVGVQYPAQTVFGRGLLGVSLEGALVTVRMASTRLGFANPEVATNTYGFLTGTGVASLLTFVSVMFGRSRWGDRAIGRRDGPISKQMQKPQTVAKWNELVQ